MLVVAQILREQPDRAPPEYFEKHAADPGLDQLLSNLFLISHDLF